MEGGLSKKLKTQPKDEDWQLAHVVRKSSHTHHDKIKPMYTEASTLKLEEILKVQVAMKKATHLLDPSLASSGKMRSGNSRGCEDLKDTPIIEPSLANPMHTPSVNNS